MVFERILITLINECKVLPGDKILVGLSGGPDSMCLLDVLVKGGYQVTVGHLDHKLRGESGEDAQFIDGVIFEFST